MINKSLKDANYIKRKQPKRKLKTEEDKICNICGDDVKFTVVKTWKHAYLCKDCFKGVEGK